MSAVRSVLVCEAQMPFVYGGAERHVRSLVRELRRHGYRAKKVSIPFKSYPKGELLAQAALWRLRRSVGVQLRDDRRGDRDEVSDLLRPPSEQGDVAVSPVPRDLRSRAARRSASSTDTEADVRLRDRLIGARHRGAGRVEAAVQQRAEHRGAAGEVQRPGRRAALPSAAARRLARRRGRSATTCCRSDGSSGTSAST